MRWRTTLMRKNLERSWREITGAGNGSERQTQSDYRGNSSGKPRKIDAKNCAHRKTLQANLGRKQKRQSSQLRPASELILKIRQYPLGSNHRDRRFQRNPRNVCDGRIMKLRVRSKHRWTWRSRRPQNLPPALLRTTLLRSLLLESKVAPILFPRSRQASHNLTHPSLRRLHRHRGVNLRLARREEECGLPSSDVIRLAERARRTGVGNARAKKPRSPTHRGIRCRGKSHQHICTNRRASQAVNRGRDRTLLSERNPNSERNSQKCRSHRQTRVFSLLKLRQLLEQLLQFDAASKHQRLRLMYQSLGSGSVVRPKSRYHKDERIHPSVRGDRILCPSLWRRSIPKAHGCLGRQ